MDTDFSEDRKKDEGRKEVKTQNTNIATEGSEGTEKRSITN